MTDYTALVREGREHLNLGDVTSPRWAGGGGDLRARLADAVDALVVERDVLRAQLDAMTAEWAVSVAYAGSSRNPTLSTIRENGQPYTERLARIEADDWTGNPDVSYRVMSRLVSPWTAVEEGEGVSDGQQ